MTKLGTTEEKKDESSEQKTEGEEQEAPTASTEGCLHDLNFDLELL